VVIEADGATYQVPLGLRSAQERPDFLRGRDDAVVGEVDVDGHPQLVYDGLLDPDLALELLGVVTDGAESAERVRPVSGEQSNSSLVYHDRLILKVFRRLPPGPNLDIEMTRALAGGGYDHVAPPLATFRRDGYDLAVVQPFLVGGSDGWALALTS